MHAADDAIPELNAELADSEIRLRVAERRIAELEGWGRGSASSRADRRGRASGLGISSG
jgi:hypothetical protein